MKLARTLAGLAAASLVCGCSSSTTAAPPTGTVVVFSNPATLLNDGTAAQVTATVTDANGNAATGNVSFTASAGALNGAAATATATLSAGSATLTYSCSVTADPAHCGAQTVLITAAWSGVTGGTHLTLQGPGGTGGGTTGGTTTGGGTTGGGTVPVGAPSAIVATSSVPLVLGLNGSGIQENGLTTFHVTDSMGNPVGGVTVNFAQAQPALVTLGHASAVTDANGDALADYVAGPEVGVSSIAATVSTTGATTSQVIAVRGAKPSASGFYFRCEKANLPVYTATPRLETMTCEVRLSDRYGNRVGVPTPVRFATEAGAIDSIAVTKGFDFANPNDPTEGTATVTFTTDPGNGFGPADVVPLAAAAGQYPWPRAAEPTFTDGFLSVNPRDQLVTIIAMTEGEEAFVDTNHNGTLDVGEVFYDLGDPFVDANDDGQWGPVYPGGPSEVRFCNNTSGTTCATYHGPNGQWDSLTTIWVPTWVVFSGVAVPSTTPAGQAPPATDYSPGCIPGGKSGFADIYVYDYFLNSPAAGETYDDAKLDVGSATLITLKNHGFHPELDNWGAMGQLGFDFDYRPVLPNGSACQAPASPTQPTACVLRLLFRDFDDGFRGTIEATVGGTGTACPGSAFQSELTAKGAHSTTAVGFQFGTTAL